MTLTITQELDYRGLRCPEPILNTAREARALRGAPARLRILCDDDAFPVDLKSWCRSASATLVQLDTLSQGGYAATVALNGDADALDEQPVRPHRTTTHALPAQALTGMLDRGRDEQQERGEPRLLDMRGMSCPAPTLALAKEARRVKAHDPHAEFIVLADDPAFALDLTSWCRSAGYQLLSLEEHDGALRAHISAEPGSGASAPLGATPQPLDAPAATSQHTGAPSERSPAAIQLNLSGLSQDQRQAQLDALDALSLTGPEVALRCDDLDFLLPLTRWCAGREHKVLSLESGTCIQARIKLNADAPPRAMRRSHPTARLPAVQPHDRRATLLVLHNDFEALMAALMTANAAAASGMDVKIFFSFWGVNLLRADRASHTAGEPKPSLFQRLFKWMMPRGPRRQQLGKLNFGGAGTAIMQGIMKDRQVMSLEQLLDSAQEQGATFIVCTTSMMIMGLSEGDLVARPNMELGGVSSFVDDARGAALSLVF